MEIVRELKDPALITQTANQAIKELDNMLKHGTPIPMSEYTKVLLWEKKLLCELFNEDLERNRLHGVKYENHTWCGVPYHEFEVTSLHLYKD